MISNFMLHGRDRIYSSLEICGTCPLWYKAIDSSPIFLNLISKWKMDLYNCLCMLVVAINNSRSLKMAKASAVLQISLASSRYYQIISTCKKTPTTCYSPILLYTGTSPGWRSALMGQRIGYCMKREEEERSSSIIPQEYLSTGHCLGIMHTAVSMNFLLALTVP